MSVVDQTVSDFIHFCRKGAYFDLSDKILWEEVTILALEGLIKPFKLISPPNLDMNELILESGYCLIENAQSLANIPPIVQNYAITEIIVQANGSCVKQTMTTLDGNVYVRAKDVQKWSIWRKNQFT